MEFRHYLPVYQGIQDELDSSISYSIIERYIRKCLFQITGRFKALKTPDGKRIGRNLLLQGLRRMGVIMKQGERNVPRQEHINAGRFEVKYSIVEIAGSEVSVPTTRVTNRGLQWIRAKFVKGGCAPVHMMLVK